jgi:hypothetical protein
VQLFLLEPDIDGILQNSRFRDLHAVQIGIEQHFSFCHSFAADLQRCQVECLQ